MYTVNNLFLLLVNIVRYNFVYFIYLGKKYSWSCRSVGYYGDTPCQDAAFSQDGSLLAVAYSQVCFKNKISKWLLIQ